MSKAKKSHREMAHDMLAEWYESCGIRALGQSYGKIEDAIVEALDKAELRGEHAMLEEWEAWHHSNFGHSITERAKS